MATKIFYNDNRIIIDGHADTPEECQAITAMCDSLANDENFKTIIYEKGHAVFERIDGGDAMMFAISPMQDYVLKSRYDNETGYSAAVLAGYGKIHDRLVTIEDATLGYTDSSWLSYVIGDDYSYEYVDGERNPYREAKGSIASRLDALESQLVALKEQVAGIKSCTCDLSLYLSKNEAAVTYETKASHEASIERVSALENKLTKTLPFTADELIAKLESI